MTCAMIDATAPTESRALGATLAVTPLLARTTEDGWPCRPLTSVMTPFKTVLILLTIGVTFAVVISCALRPSTPD